MILEITDARYVRDYVIWVRFNDGSAGEVDLANELDGPVFGPLRDKRLFKDVRVDSLLRTVVWPNEADLAPEFLAERIVKGSQSVTIRSGYPTSPSPVTAVRERRSAYGARKKTVRKHGAT